METAHNDAKQDKLIFPLRQRPQWRCDPRAMTFLMTEREDQFAAKQWINDRVDPINYSLVSDWMPLVAIADGIESFAAIISRVAKDPRIALIRGAIREEFMNLAFVNRRVHQHSGRPQPHLKDVPRNWLMIDLDSLPEPRGFDWRLDPRRAAIWAGRKYLPPIFRESAFYYQYSGSAGIKPGLRLHFFFWLDEPINSFDLKQYIIQVGRGRVDLSLYNPVQLHYTAAPIFIGRDDPMADKRAGLVL